MSYAVLGSSPLIVIVPSALPQAVGSVDASVNVGVILIVTSKVCSLKQFGVVAVSS